MSEKKNYTFRLNKQMMDKFRAWCRGTKRKPSETIQEFIEKFNRGEI